MLGKAIIGAVAVALDRAAKVDRDKFIQTLGFTSRVPFKNNVLPWPMRHPQIAQSCLAAAGIQIFDRRFINLDIRPFHHLSFHLPVDGL